jgi:hypothetical protein
MGLTELFTKGENVRNINGLLDQTAYHLNQLKLQITELNPVFDGAFNITCSTDQNIQDEASLAQKMELFVQNSGLCNSRNPLSTYWRPLIGNAIRSIKLEQLAALTKSLTYDPAITNFELSKLMACITGRVDRVELAVMQHFLWQVKRKLNGKPVSWHMMPILYGKTGSGKSQVLSKLLAPLGAYVNTGFALDRVGDDRYYRNFEDFYVIFLDEMPKIARTDIDTLKAVITERQLVGRVLFSTMQKIYKQNCTFIGTSNQTPNELVKDFTSMRRFYYIKSLDKMDYDAVNKVDFLQIWRGVDEGREEPYIMEVMPELTAIQEDQRTKDALELFITEGNLELDEAAVARGSDMYEAFVKYCDSGGFFKLTKQNFYKQLVERFAVKRVSGLLGRQGLSPHFHCKIIKNGVVLKSKELTRE